ncbi:MAG: hypothetical protein AAF412_07790 [Pseudomonadota bacterium]
MFSAFDLWSFISGLVGGSLVGSIVTYQVQKRLTSSGSGNVVDQSGGQAGGDIVGRDKKN